MNPTRRLRAALRVRAAVAVGVSVVAAGDLTLAGQRTRQAITGPVTREAVVRSLSIVPTSETTGRAEASVMLHIEFAFDSAELTTGARRDLDQVAAALADARLGSAPVTIEGHTDATGDEDYNRRLSRRRAAAVAGYLAQQGVAGSRLTAIGLGEDRLLSEYGPTDGRQRRVEVVRSW